MTRFPTFPSKITTLNGTKYFYIDQAAIGKQKGTIVLVHGWPDSWFGWRYQIPFLSSRGYRVLCISQVGFGAGTESPASLEKYTIKSVCADLAALLAHEQVKTAVFWGHDWGGAVVYRMANYYPSLARAVIAISTPYFAPAKGKYLSLEGQAKLLRQFRYQVYLASDQPMKDFSTKEDFRKFFNALFVAGKGMKLDFEDIATHSGIPETPMISKAEVEFYANQYQQVGLQPNTNWYRTRKLNFDNDVGDFKDSDGKLDMPVLFIATNLDPVLKPEMSKGMEEKIPKLTRASVDSGHWGLVEKKDEVNAIVGDYLDKLELATTRHQI